MVSTIFAQSSGYGKSGVCVFRISGSLSLSIIKILCQREENLLPRTVYYRQIYEPSEQILIDNALIIYFKSPSSFTGEDIVEIHTHGSIVIAKLLTRALLGIEGVKLAEPGEFARRAFLNNKFDLTAAEGLADLIEAETILQHKQAIGQARGDLGKLYESWRLELLKILSLLEAYIDFPDEDIPEQVLEEVIMYAKQLTITMTTYLNDQKRGELLRNGIKLAIIGEPNAGKSSLLNLLMQRDIAIVSDISGTTRDVIEGHLDIGGYPLILQDTAGINDWTNDAIEQEGIKRAVQAAKDADLKIIMFSALSTEENMSKILDQLTNDNIILVINKIDLMKDFNYQSTNNQNQLLISIKENIGIDLLLAQITKQASELAYANESEMPQITRERHRHQLQQAITYLDNFNPTSDLVLATEDIRMTTRALSNITGKITVDEILGEIFSKFCIGK
ncbi:MAG: tRNA uridine-5-carboxymethylaminomethyl(34) synthesis GTPase MnmE [Rickettsiaceae bacterium]|nr:MAG: tRNA uridine-5-carboxymethylaminomethyl(34) synthesis GTPase MnmE [Rickettsiaceae bacterium]